MQTAMDLGLLVLGLALLVQSAKIFVDASVDIARRLRIPRLIIGLTIVAMGTSAPEVVISVSAAVSGATDLAVANVIGSNLFNLMFIVGFCALLYPIAVKTAKISRDYWVSVAATLALFAMLAFFGEVIPRWASAILLAGFVVYMFVLVRHAVKNKTDEAEEEGTKPPKGLVISIVLAIVGAGLIVLGGQLTVNSAVNIATTIGITERVIGLTIVAMGTSLPEVVTTLIACKKKEGEFAIGFIVGSSVFNIMFVLGLAGVVAPLAIGDGVIFDISVLTFGTLMFFFLAKSSQKVVRAEGLAMLLVFFAYMTIVLWP